MTEREKVIYSIERCICHVPDACRDCAYDEGHQYNECVEMLLRDALELLKAQEPRIMEYHEIKNNNFAFMESVYGDLIPVIIDEDGCTWSPEINKDKNFMMICEPEEYGKCIRCWTFRPTDEQRKAVKWDG